MRNFYSVLQVAPRASEAEIKAAFRTLAKTCHPDLKPGDKEAEQAFQEAAKPTATSPIPRPGRCMTTSWRERAAVGRGGGGPSEIMSATFLLTVTAVDFAAVMVAGHCPAATSARRRPEHRDRRGGRGSAGHREIGTFVFSAARVSGEADRSGARSGERREPSVGRQ